MDIQEFERRKADHISQSLSPQNQAAGLSGLDQVRLRHEALPECDFGEISLEQECLGIRLPTPFYIPGMTAGHDGAAELNRCLASAASQRGWALGVGSQRRQLSDPLSAELDRWQVIREEFPELVLFANLGLSQVIDSPVDSVKALVESLGAQAICIHLNALQEAIQPEGTPQFKGGLLAIRRLVEKLNLPVVVKETGCGLAAFTANRLIEAGVAAIDVSGLGGTHWGRIEGARAESGSSQAIAAEVFADWGVSTVDSVLNARFVLDKTNRSTEVWASGGVRTGLDAAKLIALGADRVGLAQPALVAAMSGLRALENWMEQVEFQLRVALFCTGSTSVKALRETREGEILWERKK